MYFVKYVHTSDGAVILSEWNEPKDLGTIAITYVKSVRRSFDCGLEPFAQDDNDCTGAFIIQLLTPNS